jgi:predicted dehydrogenase
VRWGVLGVANIAVKKVIPAMQRGEYCEVTGIASRELARAEQAARELGVPKAYGSYEELLADPRLMRSIIRCRTTCTCRGPSAPPKPASTCCAKSRWR